MAPALTATSTSAASSCSRGATAANVPGPAGSGTRDLAPARRAQHGAVDDLPVGDRRRVEPERLELAEGQRGQPVAAALVAGEHGLVDDDDVAPGAGQRHRRRDPGRPGPDDHDIRHQHARTGYDADDPCRARIGRNARPGPVVR